MTVKRCFLLRISTALPMALLAVRPLGAQTSSECGITINPLDRYQLIQADLNIKF